MTGVEAFPIARRTRLKRREVEKKGANPSASAIETLGERLGRCVQINDTEPDFLAPGKVADFAQGAGSLSGVYSAKPAGKRGHPEPALQQRNHFGDRLWAQSKKLAKQHKLESIGQQSIRRNAKIPKETERSFDSLPRRFEGVWKFGSDLRPDYKIRPILSVDVPVESSKYCPKKEDAVEITKALSIKLFLEFTQFLGKMGTAPPGKSTRRPSGRRSSCVRYD